MEQSSNPEKKERNEIVCKNCGARLVFAPGTTSLKCEYCNAENEIEVKSEAIEELDYVKFIEAKQDTAPKQEIITIKCEACGAETTFDPNVVSQECAFCASPLIVKNGTTSDIIKPKSLLPFGITHKEAVERYQKWLRGLWFAPNKLKKYARQSGKLTGMYIPYWTYDSDTYTEYRGERGDDYQTTETYTDGDGKTQTRTVTHTRWTSVSGDVSRFFDDVLVVASHSLPGDYVDSLEPWDLTNLLPFDEKFLSGFRAEKYQVGLPDGFECAKGKMESMIRDDIRSQIGGDHQRINSIDMHHSAITFKHILLPLWISAYQYNKKTYRFLVNARTGEVSGERPYSTIKIILAILLALAIFGAIYYFLD